VIWEKLLGVELRGSFHCPELCLFDRFYKVLSQPPFRVCDCNCLFRELLVFDRFYKVFWQPWSRFVWGKCAFARSYFSDRVYKVFQQPQSLISEQKSWVLGTMFFLQSLKGILSDVIPRRGGATCGSRIDKFSTGFIRLSGCRHPVLLKRIVRARNQLFSTGFIRYPGWWRHGLCRGFFCLRNDTFPTGFIRYS